MVTDLIRIDTALIYPPMLERMTAVLEACRARGSDYFWTSGTRWWAEQAQLRMRYLERKGGKAAEPGYSGHQFGLAGDVAFDMDLARAGLQDRWLESDFDVYGEELARAGLRWGRAYADRPHASWPGFESGGDLQPLRKIWAATPGDNLTRLRACWEYVGSHVV